MARCARAAACVAALLLALPVGRAAGSETAATRPTDTAATSQAASELTPETACEQIRAAMHALAKTERAQALALDLAAKGGANAIVEARLTTLLERTNELRNALRRVRSNPIAADPYTEQCMRNGYRSLVDAEKLGSDVEEVLFGDSSGRRALGAPPHASPAATPRDSMRDEPTPAPSP